MMKLLKCSLWIFLAAVVSFSCSQNDGFSKDELALIENCDSIMRVLTIADESDLAVLRTKSCNFPENALISDEFKRLSELMVATVTHPSQDGVGIAGPQVGINRRVIAVQRFDKEGEPFEVYPNVRIVWASDSLAFGPEGCLSVPDRRGDVARSTEIIIEYADLSLLKKTPSARRCCETAMVRDTVKGFTAVIFQHEIDHLDGTLYIDRL